MHEHISLQHGEGLQSSQELIKKIFLKHFSNQYLNDLGDAATLGAMAISTDSFTVNPIFFPSSDIGKLSVFGTVNDLCVSAAVPFALSVAMVVEEGFPRRDLEKITRSIQVASLISKVKVVTGDFKVVEKGSLDKIIITTTGLGRKLPKRSSRITNIKHKDKILVTGAIAEHGISVMLSRKKIFNFSITSDCASLKHIVIPLWKEFPTIRFMRDPTRGGVAATLNEIHGVSRMGMRIYEENIPLRKDVKTACDILGIDPYYLACEGRAIIVVEHKSCDRVLKALRRVCRHAALIGEVDKTLDCVVVNTVSGGERILDFSRALNIPRIC